MSIEQGIKDVIEQKLNDGTIERIVGEKFEDGIKSAVDGLFRGYGDVSKLIESKIKEVMVERLSAYDYSGYIVKLDTVLQEVLSATTLDNKRILENFKGLMSDDMPKIVKMSEIWDRYHGFVEKNVETNGLEINYDDSVSYEPVEITISVSENDSRSWSSFKHADVFLECEHDEELNREFTLSRWTGDKDEFWTVSFNRCADIGSLRYLDEFSLFLIKLSQCGTKIDLDITEDENEVTPEKEPELTYS